MDLKAALLIEPFNGEQPVGDCGLLEEHHGDYRLMVAWAMR